MRTHSYTFFLRARVSLSSLSVCVSIRDATDHPQAALGPIALDLARKLDSSEHIRLAGSVLVVSVLAIVLTAPLGAVLMIRLAPVWLQRADSATTDADDDDDANGVGVERRSAAMPTV